MTSIALVVLDSIRHDVFEEHFDWLPGRRFERAYATANWTAPVHASMLTGEYGSEVGVTASAPTLDADVSYLPARAREAGYTTRCMSANPFFSDRFGFDRGFEEFVGPHELKHPSGRQFDWNDYVATGSEGALGRYRRYLEGVLACARSDASTLQSVRRAFELKAGTDGAGHGDDGASTVASRVASAEPEADELLVVNLMEAHVPYDPPLSDRRTDEPVYVTARTALGEHSPPPEAEAAYEDAVRYLSETYRSIHAELEADYDYVITCSDHGELLGEHGGRWNHVYGVYPELARVPLVVSGPDCRGTDDTPVSLLDVHRTIAELADLDVASRGQSLLSDPEPRDRLVEYRGLIDLALQRLREDGVDQATIDQYQEPLFGLVGSEGYYGYEHDGGWTDCGEPTAGSPRARLEELTGALETGADERASVDAVPEQRLQDLGYI